MVPLHELRQLFAPHWHSELEWHKPPFGPEVMGEVFEKHERCGDLLDPLPLLEL